jgi:hypothetical protein
MNTQMRILGMAAVLGLVPAMAAARNMVVENPTGQMHIYLDIAGPDNIEGDVPIARGRIEIAPGEGIPVPGGCPFCANGRFFMLTLATLQFADFNVDDSQYPEQRFREVKVRMREAVSFTATEVGVGVYEFSVPRERVSFEGTTIVNGEFTSGVDWPSEAVTGRIDLHAGTFQARVVVPKHHGCDHWPCSADGHLTITLNGVLGPDTDHDGVRDTADNCPLLPNPNQQRVLSPTLTPPPDINLVTCAHAHIGRPAAVDLCEGYPVSVTDDRPRQWPLGSSVVTWQARAASGRVTGASQQVTVTDRTPPSFTVMPRDITVGTCGPVDLGLPVAVDDCGSGAPVLTSDAPKTFGPGKTVVTWTARDLSRNQASVQQVVTVKDGTPPELVFVPPDMTIAQCAGADIGKAEAKDDCGATVSNDAPKEFPYGKETVVTWTARDGAGNEATARQTVICKGK